MQSKKRYLYIFVLNDEEQVILIHLNHHFFKWISKIKIMNSNQTNGAGKYKECSQGRQFIVEDASGENVFHTFDMLIMIVHMVDIFYKQSCFADNLLFSTTLDCKWPL
ncbi:hypothetical protein T02_12593 [Trichinella nativa]|uniref:Uncharacterized protein n=1 Tax=Trichinella nativa TaxID=6335 RepID=A0A0V1LVR8_9BILA|nr:hypothetical protein T02_12593 [Trichinella nativa]